MPTLPLLRTVKIEALVVEAMLRSGMLPLCCAGVEIASLPQGVEVPMPTDLVASRSVSACRRIASWRRCCR